MNQESNKFKNQESGKENKNLKNMKNKKREKNPIQDYDPYSLFFNIELK